jgi:hypothetical protein
MGGERDGVGERYKKKREIKEITETKNTQSKNKKG